MEKKVYSGDDYDEKFDFEFYLKMYESAEMKQENEFHNVWLNELGKQGKIGGQSILEIGTGTILQNAAAVISYFDQIVLSEFADNQRNWLHRWWKGQYSDSVQKVIQPILELDGSGQLPAEREDEIKRKLAAILPSDIRNSNPLSPCIFKPFDAIVMKWTFDAVVRNADEYLGALGNISSLLHPGAHLIVMDASTHGYEVNDVKFQGMALSAEIMQGTWKKSMFDLLDFQSKSVEYQGKQNFMYNIFARKK